MRRTLVKITGYFVLLGGGLAAGLALTELTLAFLLHHPALIPRRPDGLLSFFRGVYNVQRHIIQEDPESVRYDPKIFYTLRPGRFVFSNIEFSTPYRVNSKGMRDEEEALDHPEIVVVGDSFAMGWGARQEKTFAKLIEQRTGKRVLNTAISSYATEREMLILDRVPFDRVRTLIIQYCENDFDENDEFYQRGNRYTPSPESVLQEAIAIHRREQKYFFLRYTRRAIRIMREEAAMAIARFKAGHSMAPPIPPPEPEPADNPEIVARRFLNALVHAPHRDLSRLRIIVFNPSPDPGFIRAVARLHLEKRYPRHVREMTVLDLSEKFTPDRYFILDDHLNETGHQLIADEILKVL